MKHMTTAVLAATLILSVCVQADDLLIRDAQIHTMTRAGVMDHTDVLVRDGRVSRIGKNLQAPDGAQTIAAGGLPLTPGLFAGISAIGVAEVSGVEESVDSALSAIELSPMRPEFDVSLAYNPNSSLVPVTRIEGFSYTLLGASASGTLFGGQGRMVSLDGAYDSLYGEPVLFIDIGGSSAATSGGSRAGQWMLLQQVMDEAVNAPAGTEPAILTRAGRLTLSEFAAGGTVVFSVDRAADILQTVKFARNAGLRPVIAGGAEAWMVAGELAASKVPVLLDPLENLPSSFDALGARMDNAAILNEAGVTVAFTGAGSHQARKLRQMAGNAVSYGLPHAAALAALTVNPARIFGVADRQGSIEERRPANLVLWSGDPLEVTTVAQMVVIDGQSMPMTSRQTELRDRYLPPNPELPRAYIKP